MDPKKRKEYLDFYMKLLGIEVEEDPNCAYCPVSLTSTPEELKPAVAARQEQLKKILDSAKITTYDPRTSKYSPDMNKDATPQEVFTVDAGKVLSSRFFSGNNLLPSTGFGTEQGIALSSNRMAVILMDPAVRISRMLPSHAIYLQAANLDAQAERISQVFTMLKEYEPGAGICDKHPILLGFKGGHHVNLEAEIYNSFPELKYQYDGNVPIIDLHTTRKLNY